jgi:hypothetical protein
MVEPARVFLFPSPAFDQRQVVQDVKEVAARGLGNGVQTIILEQDTHSQVVTLAAWPIGFGHRHCFNAD